MTSLLSMAAVEPELAWVEVCRFDHLIPDRGVCALVGGRQVAVFRTAPDDEMFAISNLDPFSRANVLSRGLIGSRGDVLKVTSPVFKQGFDLRTGQCIDDPAVAVTTFEVRVVGGLVQVACSAQVYPPQSYLPLP